MQANIINYAREMEQYLKDWKRYLKEIAKKDFFDNRDKRNMVFHSMLIAIQSAIDVGSEIIAYKNLEKPQTYKDIFSILCKEKIISEQLASKMSSLAGFRNILVHIYYGIDIAKAYSVFRRASIWLDEFEASIKKFIKEDK